MSFSLRVLVVDDEPLARKRLVELLNKQPAVSEIREVESGSDAIDVLQEESESVDLVFLDVQMPGASGLEVVDAVGPHAMPTTVFVTAFDEYALQAFQYAALDYLLKPFDDDRFRQSFERAVQMKQLREAGALTDRFRRLVDASDLDVRAAESDAAEAEGEAETNGHSHLERLTIDLPGRVKVVPVSSICYVTAEDVYVKVHTRDDSYLLRERMHVLEERLDPRTFARIHRSTIVNVNLVETVMQGSGGRYAVRLSTGTRLKVSRGRYKDLLQVLETGGG